jgi:hypothetical protein
VCVCGHLNEKDIPKLQMNCRDIYKSLLLIHSVTELFMTRECCYEICALAKCFHSEVIQFIKFFFVCALEFLRNFVSFLRKSIRVANENRKFSAI